MEKKSCFLKAFGIMLLCVLFATQANAQEITVTGTVTDNFGPVIGASVVVDGTSNGCITDLDGKFSLTNVPSNGTLSFSYIGYQTQKIAVNGKTSINVKLAEDTQLLQEVVVVGYGVQRKSDLTGAVASVKAGDVLKSTPSGNVSDALQGRMAGVSVVSAGDPSSDQTIRIRGINSITADSEPLVVVDGFIGGSLKALNPADIQSIEVLKDASATAVYGSRGANGVILVTTKTPNKDRLTVSVNAFVNLKTVISKPDLLSPAEFAQLANAYGKEYNESQGKEAHVYYTPDQIAAFSSGKAGYNYIDHIFNSPGVAQNYEVSIAGGGEKTNFLASLRYESVEGAIKNSKNDAFNWRLKVDTKLKKWWKVGMNIYGNLNVSSGPRMTQYEGLLVSAINFPNTTSPTNEKGEYNNIYAIGGNPAYNPMGYINEIDGDTRRLVNNLQGYMDFNIIDGLTFRTQLGVTFTNSLATSSDNAKSYYYFKNTRTQATANSAFNWSWLNTNTLNYTKEFNKNHRINATTVLEQSYSNNFTLKGVANNMYFERLGANSLADSYSQNASSERIINTLLSGMFRVNYVLMDKYMVTASIRADGSSRLKDKWDYFPSAALAWNIKQEAFMQDVKAISQLKLRIGYGSVGNQAIEPYRIFSQMVPTQNADGSTSYTVGRPAAEYLKWERNDQINAGIDLGFFNGRLTLTADWYNKLSKDVLLEVQQPVHSGWDKLLKNACEIQNRGFEITIGADPVNGKDWNWHTDVTLSHNKGTFKNIPTLDRTQIQAGQYENKVFKMIEGEKLGTFWGYTNLGVWKSDEVNQEVTVVKNGVETKGTYASIYKVVPGQEKLLDANNDGTYNDDDQSIIGNGQPSFNWGWNNTLRYKDFDLSLFIIGFHGFDIYNVTDQSGYGNAVSGINTDVITPKRALLNRWTKENENTNIPGFVKLNQTTTGFNSRFVKKGDFIKVKSITLGYNLPKKACDKVFLNDLRLYFSVQNPFMITSYSGLDPEATLGSPLVSGVDWGCYPNSRNFLLGVNFSF